MGSKSRDEFSGSYEQQLELDRERRTQERQQALREFTRLLLEEEQETESSGVTQKTETTSYFD
jgi:cell division protein FtsL